MALPPRSYLFVNRVIPISRVYAQTGISAHIYTFFPRFRCGRFDIPKVSSIKTLSKSLFSFLRGKLAAG